MKFDPYQLAYCGIYCPQCSFRTAYETQDRAHVASMPARYDRMKEWPISEYKCECCKGENDCGPCKMQDCAGEKGLVSCADCDAFPCEENIRFDEDDSPHHSDAIANLRRIKEIGYEAWFVEAAPQMTCSCGQRLSWYYACPNDHT